MMMIIMIMCAYRSILACVFNDTTNDDNDSDDNDNNNHNNNNDNKHRARCPHALVSPRHGFAPLLMKPAGSNHYNCNHTCLGEQYSSLPQIRRQRGLPRTSEVCPYIIKYLILRTS